MQSVSQAILFDMLHYRNLQVIKPFLVSLCFHFQILVKLFHVFQFKVSINLCHHQTKGVTLFVHK